MIYLIIGRRKQGKTTLGRSLSLRTDARFTIDPRGLLPREDALIVTDGDTAAQAIKQRVADIVLVPRRSVQAAYTVALDAIARHVETHEPRSFTVLIDELRFVPDPITPALDWLMRCSDPDCVHIIFTCHRPKDVPTDIRAIADHWLIFRTTLEHDLKVIAEKSDRAALLVTKLPERQFVAWDDGESKLTVYADPSKWYTPLRAHHQQSNMPALTITDGHPDTITQEDLF